MGKSEEVFLRVIVNLTQKLTLSDFIDDYPPNPIDLAFSLLSYTRKVAMM